MSFTKSSSIGSFEQYGSNIPLRTSPYQSTSSNRIDTQPTNQVTSLPLISLARQLRKRSNNQQNAKQAWERLRVLVTVVNSTCTYNFTAPVLILSPFGRNPQIDCIVLFTNAMRRETKDLYLVLASMDESCSELVEGDISSFFGWFLPYKTFLTQLLTIIVTIMLPWAEEKIKLPSPKNSIWFEEKSKTLHRIVTKTVSHRRRFLNYSPHVAATKLKQIFQSFATPLMEFLSALEESVGKITTKYYNDQQCIEIVRNMTRELATMPAYKKTVILLLRWLENRPETCAKWRKHILQLQNPIRYMWWKRSDAQQDCFLYFQAKAKTLPSQK